MRGRLKRVRFSGIRPVPALLLSIVVVGGFSAYWRVHSADREQRLDLVVQAQLVSQGIDAHYLEALQGSPSDLALPQYRRLTDQLAAVEQALPQCRGIYILGRRDDGAVFFRVGHESDASASRHTPGQLWTNSTAILRSVFTSGRAAAEGPLPDGQRTRVSALAPVVDDRTGSVVGVLGCDLDGSRWRSSLGSVALPPALLTVALLLIFLADRAVARGRLTWRCEPLLALAAGLTVTAYAAWIVLCLEPHERQAALSTLVAAEAGAVRDRLHTVSYDQLESLGSFYEASENVTAAEFDSFCRFLTRSPAVQAWQWVPAVTAAQRPAFEAAARAEGNPGYSIVSQPPSGSGPRPPAPRAAVYYPVLYAMPPAVRPQSLGLDLGAQPSVLDTFRRAADSGLISASSPLQLPTSLGGGTVLILARPVHDPHSSKRLRGFVVATLGLPGILEPLRGTPLTQFSLLRRDSRPFALGATFAAPPRSAGALYAPILAFGQAFCIAAYPDASLHGAYPRRAGLLTAVAGVLLSLALAAVIAATYRRREELETTITARTAELRGSEQRLEQLADQSRTITWETDADGLYTYLSPVVELVTGYRPEELIGRVHFYEHYRDRDREHLREHISGFLEAGRPFVNLEVPIVARGGRLNWFSVNAIPLFDEAGKVRGYRGSGADITERKRAAEEMRLNELRTRALLRLSQMTEEPESAITDLALERALDITTSSLGYLAFLNEDETVMTMYAWSQSALAQCGINDRPIIYPVSKTGLWGEAVRQRRPIITNDYAAPNPLKKGYPEGHVPIDRHMNVPLLEGDRVVLVIGVGNKADPYDEEDVQHLTLLADGLWKTLQAKRAQEALRTAEANFRNFIETMVDAIVVLSLDSRILFTNPAGTTLLGASHTEELIGRDMRRFLAPEYVRVHEERVHAACAGPVCLPPVQTTITRLDGELLTVEIIGSGCTYNGEPAAQAVLRDVSARERSERIHQLYELLARHTHDLILFIREDGAIIEANQAALEAYGYSRAQLFGLNIRDLRAADTQHTIDEQMRQAADAVRFETVHMRNDGTCFPVEVSSRGVVINGERALLSIIRDITDRRLAEQRVAEQSRMLDTILTASPVGITLVRDRVLVWTNQALERMLGYASAELVGESSDVIYRGAGEWSRIGALLDSGEIGPRTAEADGVLTRRDGAKVGCHFFARLLSPADPARGYIIVLTDMTERRRAEEANRLASVGQLAAGVAHDFNNLLTSMLMTATLAEMGNADVKRLVDVVRKSARSGAEITGSLMTFARPDEPRRQAGRIESTLDAALSMAARQLANAEIAVARDYAPAARLLVFDPTQMEQVFLNLIINACHAMSEGGTLTVRTRYPAADSEPAVIEVADTGVGIAPEHLSRIFEPFFTTKGRLGESDTPGSGLGLSVSHGLVAAHGGSISVSSRPGEGAVFRVCLPQSEPAPAPAPGTLPEQAALLDEPIDLAGARILAADDETDVLSPLQIFLTSSGARLVAAATADEAIAALRAQSFDLVLSDLMMPGGGGRAVLEYVGTMGAAAPPVIVMTGRLEAILHEEVVALGACRSIQKPFDMRELLWVIRETLRKREG